MNVPGARYPHPNLASLFLALYPPRSALESYQLTTQYLEQVCSTRASTWIIVYVLEALSEMSQNLQSDAVKSLGRFEGLVTAQADSCSRLYLRLSWPGILSHFPLTYISLTIQDVP